MLVGRLVEHRTLADVLAAEGDAGRGVGADEVPQPAAAIDQRLGAEVPAVEHQQVEAEQHEPFRCAPDGRPERLEVGDAGGVLHAHLAVDDRRPAAQRPRRGDDGLVFRRPVVAVPREGLRDLAGQRELRPVAVVFDLVDPLATVRRDVDQGRQHGRDEAGGQGRSRHGRGSDEDPG